MSIFPARRCAWCRKWKTIYDRILHDIGAPETSGVCDGCIAFFFPNH